MSMAEPKRRKKWTLNPRGSLWANDDSKFGQKMLEKMGWSKGNGLGRDEQGIREHLAVTFKDDNKGIGYKGSDDEWIKHYEDFENVLANLNSQENIVGNSPSDDKLPQKDTSKTSLERTSKASRVRVHYHKFTRGKDLSRCTEDDLGCILGSKRAKQLAKEKAPEENISTVEEVGHVDHSMGVTTIKGCSIQDYFAQKMEALKNRTKNLPVEEKRCEEDDSEGHCLELSPGADEDTLKSCDGEQENREGRKKKKKRKKEDNKVVEIESEENSIPKKKKKKKKQDISGCDTVVMEVGDEDNAQPNPVMEEETGRKKKKKKKKEAVVDTAVEQVLDGATEEDCVRKKKKRKHTEASDDHDSAQPLIAEKNSKKKKKRKTEA